MTDREAFEAEARKHGFILDRFDRSDVYVQRITQQAWNLWQAATAHERERCRLATHDAVVRALDEAGIRSDVLRGMCIEVALERFNDVIRKGG